MARDQVQKRSAYPRTAHFAAPGVSVLLLVAGVVTANAGHLTIGYLATGAGAFLALLVFLWVLRDA